MVSGNPGNCAELRELPCAMSLPTRARSLSNNMLDYRTTSRIVVIESDDWGDGAQAVGVAAEQARCGAMEFMASNGYRRLETCEDLDELYGMLARHQDSRGRHPVVTANFLVSRPDLGAVRASGFQRYATVSLAKALAGDGEGARLLEKYRE